MNTQVLPFQAEIREEGETAVLVLIGEINGQADAAMSAGL